MERNRKTRMVAITSMLIAVVFLTIAYAVFSKNLNIQNMSATVKGNEANFSVKFSKKNKELDESDVIPFSSGGTYGLNAHIDNSGPNPKLTNISLQITENMNTFDQTYVLYALNKGGIDAYLKSIKIANVTGYDKPIVCIPSEGTSQKLVDEACKHFSINTTVVLKGIKATSEGIKHGDSYPYDSLAGNYTGITGEKLTNSNYHSVGISLYWDANLTLIDGSFEIKIGDITVEYSSQDT